MVPATRKSDRLARQSTGDVLEKVIKLKTLLREEMLPAGAGASRARVHRCGSSSEEGEPVRGISESSKTIRMGHKSGIILTDAEVRCFRAFVDGSR